MRLRRWVAAPDVGPRVGPFWTRRSAQKWADQRNAEARLNVWKVIRRSST